MVVGGHAWQVGRHAWQGVMCGRGACVAGGVHGRGRVWQGDSMRGRGVHGMHAPPTDTTRYGDMVNERAVRILLECILVPKFKRFSFDLV